MTALTTLATLKAELGITGTASDTRLTALIAQASAAIESFCDRRFERRSVTETFLASKRILYLSAWPVSAFTSISENGTALIADEGYTVDLAEGVVTRTYYGIGYGSPCGYVTWGTVVAVYTGGYVLPGTVNADLPADIERVCLDLAIRWFHGAGRDPALRSETVPGVIEQSWTASDSIATIGGLPLDLARALNGYKRFPV